MLRFTTRMTGPAGAPYYSTQYFGGTEQAEADEVTEALHDFWDAIKGFITTGVSIQIQPEVEVVNPLNGLIENVLTSNSIAIASTGNAALPKATQGLVRLRTNAFVAGRRVQGRVFIPALANDAQLTGIPSAAFMTGVANAAEAMRVALEPGNADWSVWSRPVTGEGARDGSNHPISSVSVWNQFAVLRSRRD